MQRYSLHQFVIQPIHGFVFALLTVATVSSPFESITLAQEPASTETEGKGEPNAEGEDKKTDRQRFVEQLEAFERKVAEIEELGKYGHPEVEAYARSLESEYERHRQNLKHWNESSETDPKSEDSRQQRQTTLDRMQHISLLLWQLRRVGGELGTPKNGSTNSLLMDVHKLISKYRDVMKDAKLMQRYHDLSRRASELGRRSIFSRMTNNFHFVVPKPDDSSARTDAPDTPRPFREQTNDRDAFAVGAFQSVKNELGQLVQLRWDDGKLIWDREHWKKPFAGQTLQTIDDQVSSELTVRGVELPDDDRMAQFRKKRLFETPEVMLLFQNFQHVLTGGKTVRHSSSISGAISKSQFAASEIEAALNVSAASVELTLTEQNEPRRRLTIEQSEKSGLQISLIGDHVLLIQQSPDGEVRWVDIGEEVLVINADSFAELYAKNPKQVEERLFARLHHNGLGVPIGRFDSQVISRVLSRLQRVDDDTRQQFERLLAGIDAKSFSKRASSFRELTQNAETFSTLIMQLDDGRELSTEAETRLAEIKKNLSERYGEIDALIEQAGWMNDAGYLVGLMRLAPNAQRDSIGRRLTSITDQSFGNDLEAWREWLRKSGASKNQD